jgi:hypothetical protein
LIGALPLRAVLPDDTKMLVLLARTIASVLPLAFRRAIALATKRNFATLRC